MASTAVSSAMIAPLSSAAPRAYMRASGSTGALPVVAIAGPRWSGANARSAGENGGVTQFFGSTGCPS
jgi:hypothetical protein